MFSDNKLTHCAPATQRWCIFQINAPQSLPTIARKGDYVTGWPRMIKRGPTWRREEWRWPLYVNARPHAIQRLCGLSAYPPASPPLSLPPMQDAFTTRKKKKRILRHIGGLAFSTRYAVPLHFLPGVIPFFGAPPFCNARLVSNEDPRSLRNEMWLLLRR